MSEEKDSKEMEPKSETPPVSEDAVENNVESIENAIPDASNDSVEEGSDAEKESVEPTPLEAAQSQIDELTARLRSVSAAYKRQQDEVTAQRDRFERQMNFRESKRRGDVVKVLFEPMENLRRSIESIQKAGVEEAHIDGLNIVVKSFMDGFHKLGLEEISPKGQKFDPNFHEALMQMPVQDPALKDVVVEMYSIGYRIGEIVLKPAQVIVGAYTAPVSEVPATDEAEAEEIHADEN